jgi:drug/metabolite transporter (DMT)-like permease
MLQGFANTPALAQFPHLSHHSHILPGYTTWHVYSYLVNKIIMEKRLLGIILTLLGVVGLIVAGIVFMNGSTGPKNIKAIIFAGILGAVFFSAGVTLVRNTKDRET